MVSGLGGVETSRLRGLDGLRGIAVSAVVVFHLHEPALPGGFLGVSLFFALSGFLLTTRALDEHTRTGRVDVRAFWSRRVRRLLPASLLCLVLVACIWTLTGWRDVGGDVRAAAAQVANWRLVLADTPYGADPSASPTHHFWSLAVEEQFYWVFPLLLLGALPSRRRLAMVFGFLTVVAGGAVWLAHGDTVFVYLSTLTRMGEITIGALVALTLARRRITTRTAEWAAVVSGVAGLLAMRFLSLDDEFIYEGGLLAAGAVFAVLVGTVTRSRWVARLLDSRLLAWIGTRAYGVYLFHWPVIVACDQLRLTPFFTVAVTLLGTAGLAAVSFVVVEEPVRRSERVRRPILVTLGAVGAVSMVTFLIPTNTNAPRIDFAAVDSLYRSTTTEPSGLRPSSTVQDSAPPTGLPTSGAPQPDDPTSFMLVGDSKAILLTLTAFDRPSTTIEGRPGWADFGCPLVRADRRRSAPREGDGGALTICDWTGRLRAAAGTTDPPDVALVYFGTWDVGELTGPCCGGRWTSLDDAEYRRWAASEIDALVDELLDAGAGRVGLVTLRAWGDLLHPGRVATWNGLLREAAARRPGDVRIVDLAGWLDTRPDIDELLPDGIHTTLAYPELGEDTGLLIFDEFLEEAIVDAAR